MCYVATYGWYNVKILKYTQQLFSVILLNIFVILKPYHL